MKSIKYLVGMLVAVCTLSACSTTPEANNIDDALVNADAQLKIAHEKYLENLRAYKKTDHSLTFGWFGGWTADGPENRFLSSIPDSVDLVSIWGGWSNLSEAKIKDLRETQQKKGTKFMPCVLLMDLGNAITPDDPEGGSWGQYARKFWGWVDGDDAKIKAAIEKYANALCDTVFKYDYDGFDIDCEPSYAQPFRTEKNMWLGDRPKWFLDAMAKRIGPKAEDERGRSKLLVVDGEVTYYDKFGHGYGADIFNYFIRQSYGASSFYRLDNEASALSAYLSKKGVSTADAYKKLIVTEEFEKYSSKGGVDFHLPDGTITRSYLGMAKWCATGMRKGGVGAYHMEKDYAANYKYMRDGIQIMNPAKK